MDDSVDWIRPDWPAPANVHALVSTREGGVSPPPWASLNPADHVGDAPARVRENRRRIQAYGGLPAEPLWLAQVHGTKVADDSEPGTGVRADGRISRRRGVVCVVLTADCLPVLLCNRQGTAVAALHAGWRGLAQGILEAGLRAFAQPAHELLAWLGPCIGTEAYEVDEAVRQAILASDAGAADLFHASRPGHWRMDLAGIARRRLETAGVARIHGGGLCTFQEPERFFSYRRDGVCGRMASLVWRS